MRAFQVLLGGRRGACDFVQADVVRGGGITPWLEIAALARAWGVPLAPHFMMELSSQLLCWLPHGHILENIDGGSLSDFGALAEPIRIEYGWFTRPTAPATASSSTATSSPLGRATPDHRRSRSLGAFGAHHRRRLPENLPRTFVCGRVPEGGR